MAKADYLENRAETRARVRALPLALRIAFAAACAQRLASTYRDHCSRKSEVPSLLGTLADVWARARGQVVPDAVPYDELKKLVPKTGAAQDAALSILYAVRALEAADTTADESAFFAADCVLNAVIGNVMSSLEITDYGERYDEEVLRHPAVAEEIARQGRDLAELEGTTLGDQMSEIEAARARSMEEQVALLPVSRRAKPYMNPFTGKGLPRG